MAEPLCKHMAGNYIRTKEQNEDRSKLMKEWWNQNSEERKRYSELRKAELNVNWKGDNVGYHSLHEWVKNRILKPEVCELCHAVEPHDLSNRSGKYLRDLSDWEWLCRKCHMIKDGRLDKLIKCKKRKK